MKGKEDILKFIRENRAELEKFGVKRLGLFGSVARDEATEESDVDFVVEFTPGEKNFDSFMGLIDFLERGLKMNVDLLTLESLDPDFRLSIEREVIYEEIS